jgi:hypothetical protein
MNDISIDHSINGNGNAPGPPQGFEPQHESEHIHRAGVDPKIQLKATSEDGESEEEEGTDGEHRANDVLKSREIDIVHETLKGIDVNFGYDVSALAREAEEQARMWAEAGLPRHDVDHDSPFEAEVLLARRAGEIYARWIRKVRRRVDAAISAQRMALDDALADGWRALDRYRSARRALNELAPRNPERTTGGSEQPTTATEPSEVAVIFDTAALHEHLAGPSTATPPAPAPFVQLAQRDFGRSFWLLSACLVIAEFIANAPVFTELFPLSVDLDRRMGDLVSTSEAPTLLLGLYDVAVKLLKAPEPAILALSVVTFFLFLGHRLGEGLRIVVTLGSSHPDVSAELIRRVRRQACFTAGASACGVIIMLVVLFSIRAKVLPLAEDRLARATQQEQIAAENVRKAQARNEHRERVATLREVEWRAADERSQRMAKRDYAASIAGANWPILGMNLVLVVVAVVAGFLRRELTLATTPISSEARPARTEQTENVATTEVVATAEEPNRGKTATNERLRELRQVLTAERDTLTARLADAEVALARSSQLVRCNPTAQWEGVASRLASVISAFRSHNALLRKLNPIDIKAFRRPPAINLQPPSDTSRLPELVKLLEEQRERIDALREEAKSIRKPARHDHRSNNAISVEEQS